MEAQRSALRTVNMFSQARKQIGCYCGELKRKRLWSIFLDQGAAINHTSIALCKHLLLKNSQEDFTYHLSSGYLDEMAIIQRSFVIPLKYSVVLNCVTLLGFEKLWDNRIT